jgi:hypothetical protein
MGLLILSRRSITFRQPGRGEVTVLLVPGRDQIQVVKDLAGTANINIATDTAKAGEKRVRKLQQLSRVFVGQRYIYGSLPEEIAELRNPVKVWLAEDFAPQGCQAFFFVFSETVVIHGVREQNDEGQMSWRTAQLSLSEGDPLRSIINAISDYALANSAETLTVAVLNQLNLYEKLQTGLATYGISPMPFSKLKPPITLKPLYRHFDHTIFYLTVVIFAALTFAASLGYLGLVYNQRKQLDEKITGVQAQIQNIKRNQSVGTVQDPQAVLNALGKPMRQQPSAMLDAAGTVANQFGKLSKLEFTPSGDDMSAVTEVDIAANVDNMKDMLLLDQESRGRGIVAQRPWVRAIHRQGAVGEMGDLVISVQVDEAPTTTIPLPDRDAEVPLIRLAPGEASSVVTPTAPAAVPSSTSTPGAASSTMPAPVSATAPSATTPVSSTAAPQAGGRS